MSGNIRCFCYVGLTSGICLGRRSAQGTKRCQMFCTLCRNWKRVCLWEIIGELVESWGVLPSAANESGKKGLTSLRFFILCTNPGTTYIFVLFFVVFFCLFLLPSSSCHFVYTFHHISFSALPPLGILQRTCFFIVIFLGEGTDGAFVQWWFVWQSKRCWVSWYFCVSFWGKRQFLSGSLLSLFLPFCASITETEWMGKAKGNILYDMRI
jgi:hypothetical protein